MITTDVMGSISYRYRRLTRQLNSTFWNTDSEVAHSLYIGSYGRDTAVRGVSDIDVYFQLPVSVYERHNSYQGNGQSALLQAVRNSVINTYPTTSLRGDGQVVVIPFTDGITFELLPGFANKDGSITFPDSNDGGCWRSCNPSAEMSAFAARNAEANHNLKAIGRMARIWKGQNGVNMSGMLIDTLAYNFIASWGYKDKSYMYHDYLVRDFLPCTSLRWIRLRNGGALRAADLGCGGTADSKEKQSRPMTPPLKRSGKRQRVTRGRRVSLGN